MFDLEACGVLTSESPVDLDYFSSRISSFCFTKIFIKFYLINYKFSTFSLWHLLLLLSTFSFLKFFLKNNRQSGKPMA